MSLSSSTQPHVQPTIGIEIETMAPPVQNNTQHESRPYQDDKSLTDEETGVPEQQKVGDKPYEQMTIRQKLAYGGPDMPVWRETCFLLVCCSAQLLTQASLGQALAPLHIIGKSFGIKNPGNLSWFIAAYSLTVGTFILIAGRLGDIFGHKRMMLIGWVWFALWSMLAGVAVYSGEIFFDVARALQGIGPAILLPNAIALLGREYKPGLKKDMSFSLFGAAAPIGFMFGAAFSSIFAQFAWWPWAFWTEAFVCLGLAVFAYFIIPSIPKGQETKREKGDLDIEGSITGVAGLVLFNFAWNQGPLVGFQAGYVIATLVLGCAFIALFFYIEIHRASHPLVPLKLFSGETGFVLACISVGWSSFGIMLYYLWQHMEVLRELTPLHAAAWFSPIALSGACAAITTGFVLCVMQPAHVMLIAMSAFMTGNILVATLPVHQTYWAQIFVACIIMPWGMDMSFPSATIVLSNSMPREHQGVAASLVNTLVNYSISIGLGFAGTVESQVNHHGMDVLRGYRGALYMGVGLSGLGVCVALLFVIQSRPSKVNRVKAEKEAEAGAS